MLPHLRPSISCITWKYVSHRLFYEALRIFAGWFSKIFARTGLSFPIAERAGFAIYSHTHRIRWCCWVAYFFLVFVHFWAANIEHCAPKKEKNWYITMFRGTLLVAHCTMNVRIHFGFDFIILGCAIAGCAMVSRSIIEHNRSFVYIYSWKCVRLAKHDHKHVVDADADTDCKPEHIRAAEVIVIRLSRRFSCSSLYIVLSMALCHLAPHKIPNMLDIAKQ